jgi:hypothetical protein
MWYSWSPSTLTTGTVRDASELEEELEEELFGKDNRDGNRVGNRGIAENDDEEIISEGGRKRVTVPKKAFIGGSGTYEFSGT